MKRRIISVMLAMSMVIGLVACGSNDDTKGSGDGNKDVITIEFYQTKREAVDSWDALIKEFNESQSEIVVEQNNVPDGQELLLTRMASNDLPAVFTCYPGKPEFQKMTEQGVIVELTEEPFINNILPSMKEIVTYENGEVYAMPVSASTLGIYYNKDLFEQLGETEYPTTFDELLALLKKAEEKGITGTMLPYKVGENVEQLFQGAIVSMMEDPLSFYKAVEEGKEKSADNKEYVTALENIVKLNDYAQNDYMGTSYDQAIAEFANGKSLTLITGLWALPSIKKANADLNCELAPFPGVEEGDAKAMVGLDCSLAVSVNEDKKVQDAAMEFMRFASDPENIATFNSLDGNIPTIEGVEFDAPEVQAINKLIAEGGGARFSVDFWPAGAEQDLRGLYQEYVTTKDVDATTKKFDEIFTSRAR